MLCYDKVNIRTCIAPVVHDFGRELAATYRGIKLDESKDGVKNGREV